MSKAKEVVSNWQILKQDKLESWIFELIRGINFAAAGDRTHVLGSGEDFKLIKIID